MEENDSQIYEGEDDCRNDLIRMIGEIQNPKLLLYLAAFTKEMIKEWD